MNPTLTGSTLKLSLASDPANRPSTSPPAGNAKKILIVDDSVVVLKTLSAKLRSNGYAVCTAVDGSEAVSTVRREKPDLILLDISFPPDVAHGGGVSWDGFLIMNWLRRMDESLHTPVIIITGGDPAKYKDRCLSAGAAGFFLKPINSEELLGVINKTLAPVGAGKQGSPESAPRKHVLFVDDENDWRFMSGVYLEDAGYVVSAASSGAEALVKVRESTPDLVLLDLNLAGESGLEVLRTLKAEKPGLRVVLYTGMDHDPQSIESMLRMGASRYLKKGTMGAMLDVVQEVLVAKEAQRN